MTEPCQCINCKTGSSRFATLTVHATVLEDGQLVPSRKRQSVRVCREHSQSVGSILYALICRFGPLVHASRALRSFEQQEQLPDDLSIEITVDEGRKDDVP